MATIQNTYPYLVSAFGSLALLMLIQLVIADVIGIRAKHVPGTAVESDHDNLLFRADRVVGNTNESIAIFILASIFCVFSNASTYDVGIAAWGFVISRMVYALCYYANLQTLRSIIFGVSALSLLALIVIGVSEWF